MLSCRDRRPRRSSEQITYFLTVGEGPSGTPVPTVRLNSRFSGNRTALRVRAFAPKVWQAIFVPQVFAAPDSAHSPRLHLPWGAGGCVPCRGCTTARRLWRIKGGRTGKKQGVSGVSIANSRDDYVFDRSRGRAPPFSSSPAVPPHQPDPFGIVHTKRSRGT